MRQQSETYHVLEMSGPRNQEWHQPQAGMYRPAVLLAYYGRTVEAIEEAERIHLEKYGNIHGVRFRVVTTIKAITINAGEFE